MEVDHAFVNKVVKNHVDEILKHAELFYEHSTDYIRSLTNIFCIFFSVVGVLNRLLLKSFLIDFWSAFIN